MKSFASATPGLVALSIGAVMFFSLWPGFDRACIVAYDNGHAPDTLVFCPWRTDIHRYEGTADLFVGSTYCPGAIEVHVMCGDTLWSLYRERMKFNRHRAAVIARDRRNCP